MCRFIESIRLEYGRLCNPEYHNARANRARREVLGIEAGLDLSEYIPIPPGNSPGPFKCRVIFAEKVLAVEIEPYQPARIRTLKLVDGGRIEYAHKYADRSAIDALFARRGVCDDILIVRNGLITDTSNANVAFFDGERWITPRLPLLAGTKRQELLDKGFLVTAEIRTEDISRYSICVLMNAMRGFDPDMGIPVTSIFA